MAVAAETGVEAPKRNDPKQRPKYGSKSGKSLLAVPNFDQTASVDQIVRAMRRHSCAIVRNLVSDEVMDKVAAELQPYLDATPTGSGDFVGRLTKRTSSLVVKSMTLCEELAADPLVLEVMDEMLLPRCQHYQLATTQVVSIGSGETLQPLHRDDAVYPFKHPCEESVITTIWALTDLTEENGATQIVPGSHEWDDERVAKRSDVTQAVMPKGSILFYMGSMYHGGAENYTDDWRTIIILGYSLGWLRQEENQYLVAPPEVAKKLPEKIQRLIGYALHPPFLGWYEMNDPHMLLEDKASLSMSASDIITEGDEERTLQPKGIKRT